MINDPEKLIEFVEENGEMLTNEFQIKILNLKKSAAVCHEAAPAHNIPQASHEVHGGHAPERCA